MEERKLKQKQYYDRFVSKGKWGPAVVISPTENTPRSYRVETPNRSTFGRNRRHLLHIPSPEHRVPSSEAEHPSMTTENLVGKQQPSNEQSTMSPTHITIQDPAK